MGGRGDNAGFVRHLSCPLDAYGKLCNAFMFLPVSCRAKDHIVHAEEGVAKGNIHTGKGENGVCTIRAFLASHQVNAWTDINTNTDKG